MPRIVGLVRAVAAGAVVVLAYSFPTPARAYVEAPITLGDIVKQSTNIVQMQVVKVDREKNLIIYQKLQDIKGKHPVDQIKHNIGRGGLRPGEWEEIMKWAEVGKQATFFHNGGASETYFGTSWYQAYPQGEWWGMSHGEPFLLRSYAGKVEKFPAFLTEILDNKEVVVPCMVDGDKEAIHKKTARIQRLKASLKILDYNPKRDFVGWGRGIRRLAGMAGFDRCAGLRNRRRAQSSDRELRQRPSRTSASAGRTVVLMQNSSDGSSRPLCPATGARDRMGATTATVCPICCSAPPARGLHESRQGQFRDDTCAAEERANLTAAAWALRRR